MSSEQQAVQPETPAPKEAIVVVEPEVRLGSLAINNPTDLVVRASELATVLADIIKKRNLFSRISGKEFVKCEGWTTMGAMLGVIPVEDYCRPLPNGNGFEAKINLIRCRDGQLVGSASAECTRDETNWKKRDSYSLRSMALTRATGKAFRLSYSWIMQLAGFEPTPAEEMKAEEDASIERKQVETEVERQKKGKAFEDAPKTQPTLFWTTPDKFNGHRAVFLNLKEFGAGLNEVAAEGLRQILKKYMKGDDENNGLWVPTGGKSGMDALLAELAECGVPTKQLRAGE